MEDKKPAHELFNIVMVLVTVGFVIGFGLLALSALHTSIYSAAAVTDEALTLKNGTTSTLANTNVISLSLENGTNGATLTGVTYTFSSTAGTIAWLDNVSGSYQDGVSVNATYSYKAFTTSANTGITAVINAIQTVPTTWLPLIVTFVALGLLFTIMIRSFMGGGEKPR